MFSKKKTINLALVAEMYVVDTSAVISPMKLAVELCELGESVKSSAMQCGVGRTALHRAIKRLKFST